MVPNSVIGSRWRSTPTVNAGFCTSMLRLPRCRARAGVWLSRTPHSPRAARAATAAREEWFHRDPGAPGPVGQQLVSI